MLLVSDPLLVLWGSAGLSYIGVHSLFVFREDLALLGQAPSQTPRAGPPSRQEPFTLGWDIPMELEPAQ